MASLVDLTNNVIFQKGIKIGDCDIKGSESEFNASNDFCGLIKFDKETNRFQGLHHNDSKDEFGNTWRNFGIDMATSTTLGGIKIGRNLNIDYKTGKLSAITHPNSTIQQKFITISSVEGKGDYNDLYTAINDCFGTYYNSYEDGILTDERNGSYIGNLEECNKFIIYLLPGTYELKEEIIIPPFVQVIGCNKESVTIKSNTHKINLLNDCLLKDLTIDISIDNEEDDILIYGLCMENVQNTRIENIEITNKNNLSQNHFIGIHMYGCKNIIVDRIKINFCEGLYNLKGLICEKTHIVLQNSVIDIKSNNKKSIAIILNESDILINETIINMKLSLNIFGIFLLNSSFNFKKSEINVSSDIYTEKIVCFLLDDKSEIIDMIYKNGKLYNNEFNNSFIEKGFRNNQLIINENKLYKIKNLEEQYLSLDEGLKDNEHFLFNKVNKLYLINSIINYNKNNDDCEYILFENLSTNYLINSNKNDYKNININPNIPIIFDNNVDEIEIDGNIIKNINDGIDYCEKLREMLSIDKIVIKLKPIKYSLTKDLIIQSNTILKGLDSEIDIKNLNKIVIKGNNIIISNIKLNIENKNNEVFQCSNVYGLKIKNINIELMHFNSICFNFKNVSCFFENILIRLKKNIKNSNLGEVNIFKFESSNIFMEKIDIYCMEKCFLKNKYVNIKNIDSSIEIHFLLIKNILNSHNIGIQIKNNEIKNKITINNSILDVNDDNLTIEIEDISNNLDFVSINNCYFNKNKLIDKTLYYANKIHFVNCYEFDRNRYFSLNQYGFNSNNIIKGIHSGIKTVKENNSYNNVLMGDFSGYSIMNGYKNIMIGYESGRNCDSNENVLIGNKSGYHITSGLNNLCIGNKSGINLLNECNNNICLGSENGINGNNNIQLGRNSGLSGNNNIVLTVNKNDLEKNINNKLLIDNQLDEEKPFIFGDMNCNSLSLNTNKIKMDVVLNVNGSIYAETYNNFKGCHYIDLDYDERLEYGMIITMKDKGNICSIEKDKGIIGIFMNKSEVLKNGKLELNYLICSSGMCSIWITNINGECEIGDYICSSNIYGLGMKQNDDIKRNYTIAKVIENIDWKNINDVIEFDSKLYKKKCVRCLL